MPLRKGSSKKVISQNIREFHTGKTYAHTAAKFGTEKANKQAVAVALSTARRYGRKYAEGGSLADAEGASKPLVKAPVNDDYVKELASNLSGDNPILSGMREGLKQQVQTPGDVMAGKYAVTPKDPNKITEEEAFQENLNADRLANWGAGTAAGIIGMSRLPGGAPEGSVGIGGGKLKQPQSVDMDKLYTSMTGKPAPEEWGKIVQAEKEAKPAIINKDKPVNIDDWEMVGGQKGSNPGGMFRDQNGQNWYVKEPKSEDHASNELLAARLYELAGVPVPHISPSIRDGAPMLASKIVEGKQLGQIAHGLNVKNAIAKDMPVDAWLANWDAIGTGKDNIIWDKATQTPYRIDMGGALRYRAQGAPKGDAFGSQVKEWTTFTDPKINPDAADIFGAVDKSHMADAVKRLESIEPDQIADAIATWGPRDPAARQELFDTLIARKQSVIDQFHSETETKQAQSLLQNAAAKKKQEAVSTENDYLKGKITHPSILPASKAQYLVSLAKGDPEGALALKSSLPKAEQKKINPALWAMKKNADSETKELINNLYASKVKAKKAAAPAEDKPYKTADDYTPEEIEKYYAEPKPTEDENYFGKSWDTVLAPHLASNDPNLWVSHLNKSSTPIKDWPNWKPPENHAISPEVYKLSPERKKALQELKFNPNLTIYKGGHSMDPASAWDSKFTGYINDPTKHNYSGEKAWFGGDRPEVAKKYIKGAHEHVDEYFGRATKALEVDWTKFYGMPEYSGEAMQKLIDAGHMKGADLIVLHNISDMGSPKQTQYLFLNHLGSLRSPRAQFDPAKLHPAHPEAAHVLAGVVGGGAFTYGTLKGDRDEGKMKKGGRTPAKMAIGGFNPMKWIPRPNNLERTNFRAPSPAHVGMIHSTVPGRTDKLPMNVKGGSYVIPASVVSGMAQGNSIAGANALNKMFRQGPYGDQMQKFGTPKVNFGHPMQPPRPMRMPNPAKAGGVEASHNHVPIIAAGGEYVIPPEAIIRKFGSLKKGHRVLDELVMHIRRQTIKDMKKEKPPKK